MGDRGGTVTAPPLGAWRSWRGPGASWPRLLTATAAGSAGAGTVIAARTSGVLVGYPALAVLLLVVLALPLSRHAGRRVFLAGCLLLGWQPVLWWWRLPVGGAGRVTWGSALLVGGLAAWVAAGPLRERARALVPTVSTVDVLLPATVVLGVWAVRPWFAVRTPAQAVSALWGGRDQASHLDMTLLVRTGGAVGQAQGPAPDGSSWASDNYPQSFHADVVALLEVLHGSAAGPWMTELVRYPPAVAILYVAAVTVLVAGVVAVPPLRRRPAVGIPAGGFVAAAFLVGEGRSVVLLGHEPFLLAVVMAGCVVLAVLHLGRRPGPLPVAAVGAAVTGVAQGWPLLAGMVLAALLPVVGRPGQRLRLPRSLRNRVAVLVVVAAGVGASLQVLLVLRGSDAVVVVGAAGAVERVSSVALAVVTAGAVVATTLVLRACPRTVVVARVGATRWVVVAGLASVAALAAWSHRVPGSGFYYPAKLLVGVFLVSVPILAVAGAVLVDRALSAFLPAGRGAVPVGVAGAGGTVVACVLAVLVWFPGSVLQERSRVLDRRLQAPPPAVLRLLRAAGASGGHGWGGEIYVPTLPGDPGLFFADSWYMAVTRTWSEDRAGAAQWVSLGRQPSRTELLRGIRQVLERSPDRVVLVAPESLGTIRAGLGDPALVDRVVTWG